MATVLVTGCDRGIGKALASELALRGDQVIAVCYDDSPDLRAQGLEVAPCVDVTSADAVAGLAASLRERDVKLDWLVSVAGTLGIDQLGSLDFEDIRHQFEVNAIGPLRVVQALLDRLHEGSKVGIVTSRVGSLSENAGGGMYAYRMSKAAANMMGLNLHHDLSRRGIPVVMLHPGVVDTDLTKFMPRTTPFITPSQSASGLIRAMDELTLETSGRFRQSNGETLPW